MVDCARYPTSMKRHVSFRKETLIHGPIPDRSGDRSEHDPVVPVHLAAEGTNLPQLQAAAVFFRQDLLVKSVDDVDRLAERTATVEK